MSDYIRRDALSKVPTDMPLPSSQLFIDILNQVAAEKPDMPRDEVLAEATLSAITSLEMTLGKLMEALGARASD